MLLGLTILISLVTFAVIMPIIVLKKYYSRSNLSTLSYITWVFVTILTWPLVPILVAVKKRDIVVLGGFFGSFLIMIIASWYWFVLSLSKLPNIGLGIYSIN